MKRQYTTLFSIMFCMPAIPVVAQTTIGGGACTSSSLNGTYELILTGRQVTAAGTVSRILQAVGTANFDGLSKVTFTMTANSVASSQSFGTPLVYGGTYSMQSNCLGTITINSGTAATFTVESYAQGRAFALIGSDANYAYNGSGNIQPGTCPSTLSGTHEFNATGSSLSGASVTAVLDVAGVLTFDGNGNVSANWTQVSNLTSNTVSATGTYNVNSNCLATATLSDSSGNKYSATFSVYSAAPDFAISITSPQAIFSGTGSAAQVNLTSGCSAAVLNGTYETVLSGRFSPAGVATKIFSSAGTATFDGKGKVTFSLTTNAVNGSQTFGTPATFSGTYTVQSNCLGTINLTSGDTATLSMVAYSLDSSTQLARAFTFIGSDANYALNGGGNIQPVACALATLSGTWPFSANGNSLSGTTNTGVVDIAGVLQFDGRGNVTANWSQASNTATTALTATGTYTVTPGCLATITLTDNLTNKYTFAAVVFGAASGSLQLIGTTPQLIVTGAARASFVNPGQAVVNAANYLPDQTPAGSVFTIFGSSLATKVSQPTTVPLPTTVLTTSVTVNGEPAPLFYVDQNQINAQMPWDIKPGTATVVVTNGSSASNAVTIIVPATGTPGIVVYGNNRAVVVNQNGSVNATNAPAKVGDTVVAYFTGGGPVTAAGALVTGAGSPSGLSPVSGPSGVKVGGVDATVNYIGLTPGGIGLYQANFVIPKVAAGDRAVVLTISGQSSNAPLIAVSN